jgi:hypothetical protein
MEIVAASTTMSVIVPNLIRRPDAPGARRDAVAE